jgi:type VI secretion system protein ImpH
VIARLLAEPHRFGFFQAVRLLDRWFGKSERGGSVAVLSNRVRFRNTLSLSFAASEIAELKIIHRGRRADRGGRCNAGARCAAARIH